jgi:glyoxylase-like metal-dependent hydrolase (beta-lactamase superfamily II)
LNNSIYYPIERIPTGYELIEVATNLYWMRMPMPFKLDHINLWLIEGKNDWTVIDSGLNLDNSKAYWQKLISTKFKNKPIKQVICTHMHPDHLGLSGWLCEEYGAKLWISQGEYDSYQALHSKIQQMDYSSSDDFYHANGSDHTQISHYKKHIGMFTQYVHALPVNYRRLIDNEVIMLGEYEWLVVMGSGHSPEHACLWCKSLNVFISGDQILPTISSNISVYPEEPDADPLKCWLDSCHKLHDLLDDDVFVLPAHGKPFTGVKKRLIDQINEIEENLIKLANFCTTPKRVVDGFEVLFYSEITHKNFILAIGESRAHFNHLKYKNIVKSYTDDQNVFWYCK